MGQHKRSAELGGHVLRGRVEEQARSACGKLSRIYGNRLDAVSLHKSIMANKHFGCV